jgi:processing peptidase subunit beta
MQASSRIVGRVLRVPGITQRAASTSVSTLDNGMRVASESSEGQTATVGVWIDAGSSFETDADNGSAHFLEHMAFKGTKKRTQYQLEKEIEDLGGHLNAYTSREQTVYYAKVAEKDVAQATDILSDILQNSLLDPGAIERERSVILREMEEVMSMKEEVVFDELHATAYQGTSLGRTILGPVENIRSITRDDLEKYINTHYTAPRMVFAGAGAVNHDQLVDLAAKSFDKLPKGAPASEVSEASREHKFTGSDARFVDTEMDEIHFAMAFESVGWTHPDSVAFMVMQSMLGQWDANTPAGSTPAATMCKEIVGEGDAKSIMAFNTTYSNTGLFGVYGVADHTSVENFLYIQMNELVRMCHKVSDFELERAKNQLKTTMAMQLGDGTSAVCEDIGRQVLTYGRRVPIEEMFARIDAVDADTVNRVAYDHINDKDLAFVSFGPRDDGKAKPRRVIPDYNWLRRRTYWLRY